MFLNNLLSEVLGYVYQNLVLTPLNVQNLFEFELFYHYKIFSCLTSRIYGQNIIVGFI